MSFLKLSNFVGATSHQNVHVSSPPFFSGWGKVEAIPPGNLKDAFLATAETGESLRGFRVKGGLGTNNPKVICNYLEY